MTDKNKLRKAELSKGMTPEEQAEADRLRHQGRVGGGPKPVRDEWKDLSPEDMANYAFAHAPSGK